MNQFKKLYIKALLSKFPNFLKIRFRFFGLMKLYIFINEKIQKKRILKNRDPKAQEFKYPVYKQKRVRKRSEKESTDRMKLMKKSFKSDCDM